MVWLKILFYSFTFLFGWVEFYHMINKHLLYDNTRQKSLLDRLFFLSKFVYAIWIIVGLFSNLWIYFLCLLIVSILRYPILWFGNSKMLFLYELVNTPASVMLLMVIFGFGLF
jgi:hypothetical protein